MSINRLNIPTDCTKAKVLHVISGLEHSGAENMLCKIVQNIPQEQVECSVVSLTEIGPVGVILRSKGIHVESVEAKPGKIPTIHQIIYLIRIVSRIRPDIIQGWMYHGNVAATIIGIFLNYRPRVFWNVRQSIATLKNERLLTRAIIRVSALISRLPQIIIYNSRASMEQHENIGYCRSRSLFIPNGFELQEFSPEKAYMSKLRKELKVGKNTQIVTHVARYHPKKDHKTFLEAANLVVRRRSDVRFVAVGRQVIPENTELWNIVKSFDLQNYINLLGERRDIPQLLASSDFFVSSSSSGEGFPNTIGEAMASGTPCVVTAVGESARIVGKTGMVVEPQRPSDLADVILDFLEMDPNHKLDLGIKARKRIQENYSIGKIVKAYLSMYSRRVFDNSHPDQFLDS